jgi:hypothetical protein
MAVSPRFCRQFGRACAKFKLIEVTDHFLVPIDADYPHLSLIFGLQKRCDRGAAAGSLPPPICAVHFYSSAEPVLETIDYLSSFCAQRKISFGTRRIEPPQDVAELNRIYYDAAIENNCQRVALPDSVDYLGATILTNMSLHGIFSGPSICDTVQMSPDLPQVTFIRPCCLLADSEIAKFGVDSGFRNAPTGFMLEEHPFMQVARQAIDHMVMDSNNVKLNVFNAQFHVQKKYVGASDHLAAETDEDPGRYVD